MHGRRATWGSLPIAGGARSRVQVGDRAARILAAKLAEIEARLNKLRSPFRSAEGFIIEEIIDPRDTRASSRVRELAAPLRTPEPPSFGYRP
jgi:hypothetical protein